MTSRDQDRQIAKALPEQALDSQLTRRSLLKRAAVLGMSVPALSSLLAACGGDDEGSGDDESADDEQDSGQEDTGDEAESEETETEGSATEEEDPTEEGSDDEGDSAASGEGQPGGTIRYGLLRDPIAFDPHINYGASSSTLQGNLYDTLVDWNDEGEIVPGLAESWETPDATTYIFHIRQGVTFHNGNELVADDVVHTFERILDEATGATRQPELSRMESFEATDDYTVEVSLSEPYATLLAILGGAECYIINREFTESGADYTTEVNGTGAFILDDYEPEVQYTMVKNENYWEEGLPYADQLVELPINDDTARINALLTGEINFVEYVPWQDMEDIENDSQFTLYQGYDLFNIVRLNPNEPPLDDKRVRQALNYAIDRQAVIDVAFGGRGIPITVGLIKPETPFYNEELDGHWTYDPERALSLLSEAGYEPGDINLRFAAATISVHMDTAQVVQQQLQQLGMNVQIEQQEVPTLTERRTTGDYQMMQDGLSQRPDPDLAYTNFFSTGGSGYAAGVDYSNEELDQILDEARSVLEFEERKELYKQAEEIILDDAPWIFIMWRPQGEASAANVKGYVRNPILGLDTPRYMKKVWIEE